MTVLGFTGTRNGMTGAQRDWLEKQLIGVTEFHHGACLGADQSAHWTAREVPGMRIIVHPPLNKDLMMAADLGEPRTFWLPAKDYLDRNRDIVAACDRLIALPDGPERPKSGTWYTVRYAVRVSKPVSICYPGGQVETR